jgi:hypothetical protein
MTVVVTQDMLNSQLRTCPDGSQRASYLPCPPPPAPAPAPAPGPNPSPGSVPGSAPGQFCSDRGCWGTGTVFTTEEQLNQALDANQAAAENDSGGGASVGGNTSNDTSSNDTTSGDSTSSNDTSNDTKTFWDTLKDDSLIPTVPNWIYIIVLVVSSCMSSLLFVVLLASR